MSVVNQRLKIKEVEVIPEAGEQHRVRVTLIGKGKSFVGECTGEGDGDARLSLAVEATLDAIAKALVKPMTLKLKGINSNEVFEELPEGVLIVVVTVSDASMEMVMPGSCRISGDKMEAAIKATLDATNRIAELYM